MTPYITYSHRLDLWQVWIGARVVYQSPIEEDCRAFRLAA